MVASAPQSQSQSQPISAEEELLKRNTDCVYFLASPLTCKKGNECEYRHSDIARVNPRDCYFWLHGNCLNPKCAFRHPPLEGLLGTQVPTSTGPSAPVSQTVMVDTPHVTNAVTSKPGVPTCVFFQKGYCMKGDWCPFLHTPNSLINKPSPMPVAAPPLAANKKALIALEKTVQEKKVQPVNAAIQSVKDSKGAKPTFEVELAPHRNEFILNRREPQTVHVSNGNPVNWPLRVQQYRHLDEPEPENINSKDTEEFSRELSPGFDVLVDDDVRDTNYYPGEDRYRMPREHDVLNEYNIGFSTDNDERYQGSIGYDSHGSRIGQYDWEQQRGSSERSFGVPYSERRPYSRSDAVGQEDGLDLRHRLEKKKKPNGLRSVISNENTHDMRVGDRRSYREENRNSSRENSLRSRLRGRISLPGKSQSPNNRDNMIRGRLSPARENMSAHQRRARERIVGRVEEGFSNNDYDNNGGRNYRGPHSRRDDGAARFSGPKSLADLKHKKNEEPSRRYVTDQQQSLGKRKHQESGNAISFEGPKPLEEILKRKRSEKIQNSSGNEGFVEDKSIEEGKDHETYNETVTPVEKNGEVYADDDNHNNSTKEEGEDGGVLDDQEGEEAYEQQRDGGGETDYEQVAGEDDDLYDGENREYMDEDDDDDFAKKMGVMYS